jgi:hypothetical protein
MVGFNFRIGIAAIFKKACARSKNLIKRQTSLPQHDGAE